MLPNTYHMDHVFGTHGLHLNRYNCIWIRPWGSVDLQLESFIMFSQANKTAQIYVSIKIGRCLLPVVIILKVYA
mgnify:CR=1 FL=1